jgi:hypothetical protein
MQFIQLAQPADAWTARGRKWDPDLHFTGLINDGKLVSQINALLDEYGISVEAFWLYSPAPGMFSFELQFVTERSADAARTQFNRLRRGIKESKAAQHMKAPRKVSVQAAKDASLVKAGSAARGSTKAAKATEKAAPAAKELVGRASAKNASKSAGKGAASVSAVESKKRPRKDTTTPTKLGASKTKSPVKSARTSAKVKKKTAGRN